MLGNRLMLGTSLPTLDSTISSIYEPKVSAPRLRLKLLADAHEVLGNRLAAVCIELTKKFERIHRGPLAELAELFVDQKVKGEVTVVIAGNNPKFQVDKPETEE